MLELAETNKKKLRIKKAKTKQESLLIQKKKNSNPKLQKTLQYNQYIPIATLLWGSPLERRAFLDWGLFHVEQIFKKVCKIFKTFKAEKRGA